MAKVLPGALRRPTLGSMAKVLPGALRRPTLGSMAKVLPGALRRPGSRPAAGAAGRCHTFAARPARPRPPAVAHPSACQTACRAETAHEAAQPPKSGSRSGIGVPAEPKGSGELRWYPLLSSTTPPLQAPIHYYLSHARVRGASLERPWRRPRRPRCGKSTQTRRAGSRGRAKPKERLALPLEPPLLEPPLVHCPPRAAGPAVHPTVVAAPIPESTATTSRRRSSERPHNGRACRARPAATSRGPMRPRAQAARDGAHGQCM
jgi:hypothetical protein